MKWTKLVGMLAVLVSMAVAPLSYAITTCTLTPQHAVLSAGQSAVITATCNATVSEIEWFVDDASTSAGKPLTSNVTTPNSFYFNTSPDLSSGSHSINIVVNAEYTAPTSIYNANTVNVVVQAPVLTVGAGGAPGVVTSAPSNINCDTTTTTSGSCTDSKNFGNGAVVTLTAAPGSGSSFAGWGGDCSGTGACSVVMSGDRHVTAAFSVQVNGSCGTANGQTLTTAPSTSSAQCTAGTYTAGTATASSLPWTCSGTGANGSTASCSATRAYTIPALVAGSGGTISPNSQPVGYGLTTTFTVTPQSGSGNFASVTGCNGSLSGGTYTTGTITGDCSVSATFSSVVNGSCGTANGQTLTTAPSSNQCAAGTYTPGTPTASSLPWTCVGSGTNAQTASCSATRAYTVSPSAGANGSISPSTPQTVAYNGTQSFSVTPTPGTSYSATVSGCSGTLSGTSYVTGAITADCGVSASFALPGSSTDPWKWTGFWTPPNTTNVIVADQTGRLGAGAADFVPGCLNQQTPVNTYTPCATNASYGGVSLSNGQIVSLRFTSDGSAATSDGSYFTLSAGQGGNVLATTYMWLSTTPGADMNSVPSACSVRTDSTAYLFTGPSYCQVLNNTKYYLNLQVPSACSNCVMKVIEDSNFN